MTNPVKRLFVFRGTPVTCATGPRDLLYAAAQDMTLNKVSIAGCRVNAKIYGALNSAWPQISPHLQGIDEAVYVGHSLGACHALGAAAFTPRSVPLNVFAFAPFQFADAAFWKATFGGRKQPLTWGRSADFAPGWDHTDLSTALAAPITHLMGNGKTETLVRWPVMDESIADHDVNLYSQDLALVPGADEAYLMCRLAAAVYAEKVSDAIEQIAELGHQTLDVIEMDGFRCAVLEPVSVGVELMKAAA